MRCFARRQFLAGIAGAAGGSAGCTGFADTRAEPTTTTRTTTAGTTATRTTAARTAVEPVGSSVPLDGSGSATLDAVAVQRQFTYLDGSHVAVGGDRDRVYLLAPGTANLADRRLELRVGDQRFEATDDVAGVPVYLVRFDRKQVADPGLYAFDLPADLDGDDAGVLVADAQGTVGWSLPGDVVSRLVAPPTFEGVELDAPESVAEGEPVEASVSVENVGGSDGTFVAELGPTTYSDQSEVYVEVPAGSSAEATESFSTASADGSLTLRLDWGYGSVERTVEVA